MSLCVEANLSRLFIIFLFLNDINNGIAVGDPVINREKVGIPLTG